MSQLTNLLTKIKKEVSLISENAEVLLYGNSLRRICLGEHVNKIDIIVTEITTKEQKELIRDKIKNIIVNIKFLSKPDFYDEWFTLDNLYSHIPEDFSGDLELKCTNRGLVDFNKKIIKLTKSGENNILNVDFLLDILNLVSNHGFSLNSDTIYTLFTNKEKIKQSIEKRTFFVLKKIFTFNKPRKCISLLNTLGLSKELFGNNLYESPIINNLSKSDIYEFLYMTLMDIDKSHLGNKGFTSSDINYLKLIGTCIDYASNNQPKEIFTVLQGKRINNIARLLRKIGFKDVSKKILDMRSLPTSIDDICIVPTEIKDIFNIFDDSVIEKIMNLAFSKIIEEPEYNEKYKILSYINDELHRGNI